MLHTIFCAIPYFAQTFLPTTPITIHCEEYWGRSESDPKSCGSMDRSVESAKIFGSKLHTFLSYKAAFRNYSVDITPRRANFLPGFLARRLKWVDPFRLSQCRKSSNDHPFWSVQCRIVLKLANFSHFLSNIFGHWRLEIAKNNLSWWLEINRPRLTTCH